MTDSVSVDRQFDRLMEEFVARSRRGECPSAAEYASEHPELADRIRELFPWIAMLEECAPVSSWPGRGRDLDGALPQRLGDYELLREVGRGGMGIVYEAEQVSLGRHVALKVLPYHALMDERTVERFQREAQAAARLHHGNIVPVFGVGEHDGVHYFAMQFIRGQPLDQVIEELRRLRRAGDSSTSVLPSSESGGSYFAAVARVGQQVAEALAYAHGEGVLHRDIKPSNLILDANGTVWVTDFGLAKAAGKDELTLSGDVVGTLAYMAPERFSGWSDPRSDVYGVGLTLYELLTLRPAYHDDDRNRLMKKIADAEPPDPRRIDRRVPKDLETIVLTAIAKDPGRRYRSAAELAEDLRRFRDGEPVLAQRSGVWSRSWHWARRRPAAAALVVVSLLSVLTVAIVTLAYSARLEGALRAEVRQSRSARALALANASAAVEAEDPMLALLLAREAARVETSVLVMSQVREAIRESLERVRIGPRAAGAAQPVDEALWAVSTPSGDHVLVVSKRATRLCEPDGRVVRTFEHGAGWNPRLLGLLPAATFSPRGERLLTFAGEDRVQLRDVDGTEIARLAGDLQSASFAPDGARFLTIDADRVVRLWSRDGAELERFGGPDDGRVGHAAFAPHADTIACTRYKVRRADRPLDGIRAGDRLPVTRHGTVVVIEAPGAVRWSPDGARLLFVPFTADRPGPAAVIVEAFAALLLDERGNIAAALHDAVCDAAYSPDGERVATASEDRTARVWTNQGEQEAMLIGHEDVVTGVGFSPAGDRLVTCSDDHTARVWSVGGEELVVLRHDGPVHDARFLPCGRRVVTASADGTVRIWGVERCEVAAIRVPESGSIHAAVSPAEDRVVAWSDASVRAWTLDGRSVAVEERDRALVRARQAELEVAAANGDRRVSPRGDRTLTCGQRSAWLCDAEGRRLCELRGHEEQLLGDATFSPAGEAVLTVSSGFYDRQRKTARLWSADGEELAVFHHWNAGRDLDAVFSPSGRYVVTAFDDGSVRVWLTRTEDLLALLDRRVTREFTVEEQQRYAALLGAD